MTLVRPKPILRAPIDPPIARLLWLPALGVPARKYERLADALAQRGIAVALHEWRGTGDCRWRAGRTADWGYREWLREDVPASLAHLARELPPAPLLLGGHSIGGQHALIAAALGAEAGIDAAGGAVSGIVAVGSGVPHWRLFPTLKGRVAVGGFALALPALTGLVGHYPGQRLGFAGRESGQLMRDWAQTVRRGCYGGLRGLPDDLDARMRAVRAPMLGLRFTDDWLVPAASMDALLERGGGEREHQHLDTATLGTRADHFAWMREPAVPAGRIAAWWRARAPLAVPSLSA